MSVLALNVSSYRHRVVDTRHRASKEAFRLATSVMTLTDESCPVSRIMMHDGTLLLKFLVPSGNYKG
jgi:hypothetical protein